MKRFTKMMLIISTVFMVLGIAMMLGTGLVDDLYYGNEELNIGPVGIRMREAAQFVERGEEWLENEFGTVVKAGEGYHDVRLAGNEVRELEIDVKAASLEIVRDERIDGIAIVEGSKLLDVYHSVDENTLCLDIKKKGKYESINNVEDAKLILRIPAHMEFEELDINLNAGALEADQLDAKELSLNLNASAAEIQELNVGVLDVENNAVILGVDGVQNTDVVYADTLTFMTDREIPKNFICDAKIRYNGKASPAKVEIDGLEMTITFDSPQRAASPGQSVVLYKNGRLLGGGIMKAR